MKFISSPLSVYPPLPLPLPVRQKADEFCVSFCYYNHKGGIESALERLHYSALWSNGVVAASLKISRPQSVGVQPSDGSSRSLRVNSLLLEVGSTLICYFQPPWVAYCYPSDLSVTCPFSLPPTTYTLHRHRRYSPVRTSSPQSHRNYEQSLPRLRCAYRGQSLEVGH